MTSPGVEREVERRLRECGVRYTRGRRHVVAALLEAGGPRTAAELHGRLGVEVPLSSLYRSLSVLEEAGVVVARYAAKGLTRYELAEWLTGHHHHLICIDCGAIEDVDIPSDYEAQVRRLVADIAKPASFDPVAHVLEIEGRCAACA